MKTYDPYDKVGADFFTPAKGSVARTAFAAAAPRRERGSEFTANIGLQEGVKAKPQQHKW